MSADLSTGTPQVLPSRAGEPRPARGSRAGAEAPMGPAPAPASGSAPALGLLEDRVGTTVLEVVIPVLDEARSLAACIARLDRHLRDTFPYPYRITIADNGSTDGTDRIAGELARTTSTVSVLRLDRRGRGLALRAAWSASDAFVLAYMDVDLSTDLDALWTLVAPLMSGHSDLAIGTRLHRSSRVMRGTRREVISRCYNAGLSVALGASFTDAQCGFKAIRGDVARELLPLVRDDAWFFDTELLVIAERCGFRIHEVPVDWYDDPDSRVDVVATARDDIRGVLRLRGELRHDELPIQEIRGRMGRTMPSAQTGGQVIRFAAVGAFTTVVHLGGFTLLHLLGILGAQGANTLALLVATGVNTSVNRRWTFGVRSRRGALVHQAQGLGVLVLTWALTTGALAGLDGVWPTAPTGVQTVVLGAVTIVSTVVKFLVMRRWRGSGPELDGSVAARSEGAPA